MGSSANPIYKSRYPVKKFSLLCVFAVTKTVDSQCYITYGDFVVMRDGCHGPVFMFTEQSNSKLTFGKDVNSN